MLCFYTIEIKLSWTSRSRSFPVAVAALSSKGDPKPERHVVGARAVYYECGGMRGVADSARKLSTYDVVGRRSREGERARRPNERTNESGDPNEVLGLTDTSACYYKFRV